ncbi:ImmA/IrrE family metallo-endopeptidase [Microbacterium sp. KNMS]
MAGTRNNIRARLLDLVDYLGYRIVYTDLSHIHPPRDGDTDHETRTIRLQPDMAHRLWVSTLAHEIAHVVYMDFPTMFGPVHRKQERRADEWAARLLIPVSCYREVEEYRGGHIPTMALDLGVTVKIVEAFQRLLLRLDDTVYVRPRDGAGQWDHKIELDHEASVA